MFAIAVIVFVLLSYQIPSPVSFLLVKWVTRMRIKLRMLLKREAAVEKE